MRTLANWTTETLFNYVHGNYLVYNTCWEDPRLDREVLSLGAEDELVLITSAGCNALDYALDGPRRIHAVDMNFRQMPCWSSSWPASEISNTTSFLRSSVTAEPPPFGPGTSNVYGVTFLCPPDSTGMIEPTFSRDAKLQTHSITGAPPGFLPSP